MVRAVDFIRAAASKARGKKAKAKAKPRATRKKKPSMPGIFSSRPVREKSLSLTGLKFGRVLRTPGGLDVIATKARTKKGMAPRFPGAMMMPSTRKAPVFSPDDIDFGMGRVVKPSMPGIFAAQPFRKVPSVSGLDFNRVMRTPGGIDVIATKSRAKKRGKKPAAQPMLPLANPSRRRMNSWY